MKLLLIGNGAWGKNYITTIQQNWPNIQLDIATRQDWQQKVNQKPNGVMICTGPLAQVDIAKYVLERYIPVMLEKPVALSSQELEPLLPLQYNAPILVNYTHLFANHFIELKKYYNDDIRNIQTHGRGKGPYRNFSSLFDYGSHDVAMILDLIREYPNTIIAKKLKDREIFDIRLQFSNIITKSYVGNGTKLPRKLRQIVLTQHNGTQIVYSDIEGNRLMEWPLRKKINVKYTPPLTNAIQYFIDLINGKQDDRAGLDLTIKVVKILEECYKQASEAK